MATLLDRWRRSDPSFAPSLCEPLIRTCARQLEQCPAGAVIADLGCGNGAMAAALRDAGYRAIGIDADPSTAAARRGGVPLLLGDGEQLPLRTRSIDALFVFSAFQYMDRERALSECSRVLKPAGRFAIVENLHGNPVAKLDRAVRAFRGVPYPAHYEPRAHLRWRDRHVYERHFSEVRYETHHVLVPLFLLSAAVADPSSPASRWNRAVLAVFRALQRLERRILAAGLMRAAAWHVVISGRR